MGLFDRFKSNRNTITPDSSEDQREEQQAQPEIEASPEKTKSEQEYKQEILAMEDLESALELLSHMESEEYLKDIVNNHPNEDVKIKALERLDPKTNYSFFSLAWEHGKCMKLRKRALEMSGPTFDQEDIIHALDKESDTEFRKMLLDRVEKLKNLIWYKDNDKDYAIVEHAKQLLAKHLEILIPEIEELSCIPKEMIESALPQIVSLPKVTLDKYGISIEILKTIEDQELLESVALHGRHHELQTIATEKIDGDKALVKIVIGAGSDHARDIAVSKLSGENQELIEKIIEDTPKARHKIAALNLLKDKNRAREMAASIVSKVTDSTTCEDIAPFLKDQDLIIQLLKDHAEHHNDFVLDAIENLYSEEHLLIAARDIEVDRNRIDNYRAFYARVVEKISNKEYLNDILHNALSEDARLRASHKLGVKLQE